MQVVSFETAKKLKAAGFPQPKRLSYGSGFYLETDEENSDPHFIVGRPDGVWHGPQYVFAPGSVDILNMLNVLELLKLIDQYGPLSMINMIRRDVELLARVWMELKGK